MQILSRLPGRLRVGRVLDRRPDRARAMAHALEDELAHRPGVRGASASAWTGSVLVLYDPARLSEREVVALLTQILGHLQTNG
jgi:hypothetical protein